LGNGDRTSSSTAVNVLGLASGVVAVSAGGSHTCALTVSGGVKCWGDNDQGQVGDGTAASTSTPVDVSGLTSGVGALSAGSADTCALTTSGSMKCWGYNGDGELGSGAVLLRRSSAVEVTRLRSHVLAVDSGNGHACVVTVAHAIECWGDNRYGQLGDGTTISRFTPVEPDGMHSGVRAVSTGAYNTCALTLRGSVKCWGDIAWSDNGRPMVTSRPADVAGLRSGVVAISAGGYHTCALISSGAVKCWGVNLSGELGNGTTVNSPIPVAVTGLGSRIAAISAGWFHTCAVTVMGAAKCWGTNADGELGTGTNTNHFAPVDVSGLASGVVSISAGYDDTCALTTSGSTECWGRNAFGQLGDGTNADSSVPQPVSGLASAVSAISSGEEYNCALTISKTVQCWGRNNQGQLDDGTTINRSIPVNALNLSSGVTAISRTCAIAGGALKCWGDNASGNLGIDPGWTPVDTGESFFVAAAPTAPLIRTVIAGNASVSVAFVAPSSDGGSRIVRTRVTCRPLEGGHAIIAYASRSPVVVSGLVNAHEYSCVVRVINAAGKSARSAASKEFVPRGNSNPPTNTSSEASRRHW